MYKHIVANKGQELDVLGELEEKGFRWVNHHNLPTSLLVSEADFVDFPYVIIADSTHMTIEWSTEEAEFKGDVVFDGREELNMKKYKVTKEFMDNLVAWRAKKCLDVTQGYGYVALSDLAKMPAVVEAWWLYDNTSIERNSRLIAIISWLNGEDVFEVEKPRKFVVRSDSSDREGGYWYVFVRENTGSSPSWPTNGMAELTYIRDYATEFDTYREASGWANSHQVVVEVDADGKEV